MLGQNILIVDLMMEPADSAITSRVYKTAFAQYHAQRGMDAEMRQSTVKTIKIAILSRQIEAVFGQPPSTALLMQTV